MAGELRVRELTILKTIAETLNRAADLEPMLREVLHKLLEVTGLQTGWIFLVGDDAPSYVCATTCNLPPALSWGDQTPMRQGACWCLAHHWDGRLKAAINVMECKRCEDAATHGWGDLAGIAHHATVPLTAGGERFGIMNVAGPGKEHFTDEELTLLGSVAFQIGTAVERIRLFQLERRRAESYERLGEVARRLSALLDSERLPAEAVQQVAAAYGWPVVALFTKDGTDTTLRASVASPAASHSRPLPPNKLGVVGAAMRELRPVHVLDAEQTPALKPGRGIPAFRSAIACPLQRRGEAVGALLVGSPDARAFQPVDVEIVSALAAHLSLAIENARLHEQRRELARVEERNRLARDLHDSVCQTLFSLNLTARGAEGLVTGQPDLAGAALREIQEQAQGALQQMRSLIWQLRPAGLEDGLLTALKRYGESMALTVEFEVQGLRQLPRPVEEALWRIGQESLNNVKKHAGAAHVKVRLAMTEAEVRLEVLDGGRGFSRPRSGGPSLGMTSMRERAEALGGTFAVESQPGNGTATRTCIPCAAAT